MKKCEMTYMLSENNIEQLHLCLLNMLKDIDIVCKKHKINYMLGGGSALGAVRHKGFIPWDDDLDLNMPRKDYEKFIDVMEKELGAYYDFSYPNSKNVEVPFLKVYKKNTILREVNQKKIYDAVWIDIFPMEYAPNNLIARYIKGLLADILHFIMISVYIFSNKNLGIKKHYISSKKKLFRYYLALMIGYLLPFCSITSLINIFDKFVTQKKESYFYTVPTGRNRYLGECFTQDKIFPLRLIKFGSLTLNVYGCVENYLSRLYGDYMVIPPEHKREHHYVEKFYIDENIKWLHNEEENK